MGRKEDLRPRRENNNNKRCPYTPSDFTRF
jgi:hypothetical protein